MKTEKLIKVFFLAIMLSLFYPIARASDIRDTTYLRISFHVFNDEGGQGNFHPDSSVHSTFLGEVIDWINFRLLNLAPIQPEMPSEYVKSTGIQIRVDSFFYHSDNHAWDCSNDIDSHYMRTQYVDNDSTLDYKQKYQTLAIFLGSNYDVIGGHNSLIGDKRFIAMRGLYSEFINKPHQDAVRDCGRGLLHELGHSLGLSHNFAGGLHGDQCDECDDNGCPQEGTSNNIMDYWPKYGYALSACQLDVIQDYIKGNRGNISDVIWNDSCYSEEDNFIISDGFELVVNDTLYIHGDLVVESGGRLIVSGYLSFPSLKSLIIQPGAEVFVRGGTLGNLCGDLWEGVSIIDNISESARSKFDARGGIIENARIGISSGGNQMVILNEVCFRDNLLSLNIIGSQYNEEIRINSCQFEVTGNVNHWEEGEIPEIFVKIRKEAQAVFNNCDFINHEGHRIFSDEESGIGIFLENSSLKLNECNFSNLFKGVYATASGSAYSLNIDSSHFTLCHCGVQLNYFPFASVRSSVFSQNRINSLPSIGLYASGVNLLDVRENSFFSDYGGEHLTGIVTDHTVPGTHMIENNQFAKLHNGIMVILGSDLPELPKSMFQKTFEELVSMPLGTIWSGNTFAELENEYINIFPDGMVIASGNPKNSYLLDITKSRKYPHGGFAPFSRRKEYFVVESLYDNIGINSEDNVFFILSDSSWQEGYESNLNRENVSEYISSLSEEYLKGMEFPAGENPISFEGLVSLAQHLESYPWLSVFPSFKSYVLEQMNVIPVWFWDEIEASLSKKDPWKSGIYDLLIYLAKIQVDVYVSSINFSNPADSISQLEEASSPIGVILFPALSKLNIGIIYKSKSDLFSVVPNPNNGEFGINPIMNLFSGEHQKEFNYRIISLQGKLLKSGTISKTKELLLDIRPVEAGSYLLEIWSDFEFLGVEKFIILPD